MGKTIARWVGIVLAILGFFGAAVHLMATMDLLPGSSGWRECAGLLLAAWGVMGVAGLFIAVKSAPNKRPVITARRPTRPRNPND